MRAVRRTLLPSRAVLCMENLSDAWLHHRPSKSPVRTPNPARRFRSDDPWPRPLSIAMVAACPFPTHQGTQIFIRHLATALAEVGHDIHVITYADAEHPLNAPFQIHRAPTLPMGYRSGPHVLKPAMDVSLALTALRVVRKHGCEVVHAHNVEALGVGALLKLACGIPLVYHSHNAMGAELPTYFRHGLLQSLAAVLGEAIDRTLPRLADAVIAFDEDHKALHEIYGVADDHIFVIPPGLHGPEIRGAPPELVHTMRAKLGVGPFILYAGNPDGYQNLSLLWEAFARVRVQRPDARLLVATHHPPAVFAAPRDAGVTVYQFATLDELRALFAIADIGVCTRTLWTGVPIKVLNYLAAGLPVVACRNATRHLLTARTGRVVDASPDAFATAIIEVLSQRDRRRVRHARGFERFRVEGHVAQYEHIYWHVLR